MSPKNGSGYAEEAIQEPPQWERGDMQLFPINHASAMLQNRSKNQSAGSFPAVRGAPTLPTVFSAGAARMTVCAPG